MTGIFVLQGTFEDRLAIDRFNILRLQAGKAIQYSEESWETVFQNRISVAIKSLLVPWLPLQKPSLADGLRGANSVNRGPSPLTFS
jgi:hypothetical protein